MLGACPECFQFGRKSDFLYSEQLPSTGSPYMITNFFREECAHCGYEFGVKEHSTGIPNLEPNVFP